MDSVIRLCLSDLSCVFVKRQKKAFGLQSNQPFWGHNPVDVVGSSYVFWSNNSVRYYVSINKNTSIMVNMKLEHCVR